MKVYEISYTEDGEYRQFTLYASETGKLEEFVNNLQKRGCEIHEIKLTAQLQKQKKS